MNILGKIIERGIAMKYIKIILYIIISLSFMLTSCVTSNMNVVKNSVQSREITIYKSNINHNMITKKINYDEALRYTEENEILLNEANNYGIVVTLDEAKKVAEENKTNFYKANDPAATKSLYEYLKNSGITLTEYWNVNLPKTLKIQMTKARVKNALKKEIEISILKNKPNISPNELIIQVEKMYKSKINSLIKSYKIHIVNDKIKNNTNITKYLSGIDSSNQKENVSTTLFSLSNPSIGKLLTKYKITVKTNPIEKFKIKIPVDWSVNAGEYPDGLYWRLVNEFSKDIGFDLSKYKGTSAEVWRYELANGLPGQGEQSKFRYPTNVIFLIKDKNIIGAWMAFNKWYIGPSLKKRYLNDITGSTYQEWVEKENLFIIKDKNRDLIKLDPVSVVKAFFKAIQDRDKNRAYTCLDPIELLNSLTMNLVAKQLYNPKFDVHNSMVENIVYGKPISFIIQDTKNFKVINNVTNEREVELSISLEIKWKDNTFNSANGKETRFVIMKKYKDGWKMGNLGTGP